MCVDLVKIVKRTSKEISLGFQVTYVKSRKFIPSVDKTVDEVMGYYVRWCKSRRS